MNTNTTAEQQARDMLKRIGVEDAQSFSAGDLVELANLIARTPAAPVVPEGYVIMPAKLTHEQRVAAKHKLGFTQMYAAAVEVGAIQLPAPVVAEGLEQALTAFGNLEFECGAWDDEHPDIGHASYEALVEKARAARDVVRILAAHPVAGSPVKVAGLGRIWNEEDGFLELQFKDEDAAQAFMQNYEPTVDVRDMPSMHRAAAEPMPASEAQTVEITRGNGMWHTNCSNHFGGPMKEVAQDPTRSIMKCLSCGKHGYYPVGGVGRVCSEEVAAPVPASEAALSPDEMAMVTEAIRSLETGFMPNAAAILRRLIAAPAAPTDAQPDGLTLSKAMDASYPIPDTPHASVRERAMDDRKAFMKGWNACVTYVRRPAAPTDAKPTVKNPHSDYLAAFWDAGFNGTEFDPTNRGHALAAFTDGMNAAQSVRDAAQPKSGSDQ